MKRLYRNLVFKVLSRLDKIMFCQFYNFIMTVNSSKLRCEFIDALYSLRDQNSHIYFTRPSRYRYYSEGIRSRLENLFFQYTGHHVNIRSGDIVLDCGANIGEFSIHCASFGAQVFCFEPDPDEFCALERNLKGTGCVFPYGLWFEDTKLIFNLQNDTGDSSAASAQDLGQKTELYVKRLDSFSEISKFSRIRLLKLEAEGFELEVLQGATGILGRIEYIAADLGPERGPDNENSLPDVVNFLFEHNYTLEYFLPSRSIALFKNKICSSLE